jgi:hypothetical protein
LQEEFFMSKDLRLRIQVGVTHHLQIDKAITKARKASAQQHTQQHESSQLYSPSHSLNLPSARGNRFLIRLRHGRR